MTDLLIIAMTKKRYITEKTLTKKLPIELENVNQRDSGSNCYLIVESNPFEDNIATLIYGYIKPSLRKGTSSGICALFLKRTGEYEVYGDIGKFDMDIGVSFYTPVGNFRVNNKTAKDRYRNKRMGQYSHNMPNHINSNYFKNSKIKW